MKSLGWLVTLCIVPRCDIPCTGNPATHYHVSVPPRAAKARLGGSRLIAEPDGKKSRHVNGESCVERLRVVIRETYAALAETEREWVGWAPAGPANLLEIQSGP